jgi:hypothetical protein
MTAIEETSARQSSASATSSATSIRACRDRELYHLRIPLGQTGRCRLNNPRYSFRPWAHSSMDCLMQQHPFQKLLDFSIGDAGKQDEQPRAGQLTYRAQTPTSSWWASARPIANGLR